MCKYSNKMDDSIEKERKNKVSLAIRIHAFYGMEALNKSGWKKIMTNDELEYVEMMENIRKNQYDFVPLVGWILGTICGLCFVGYLIFCILK